MSKDSRIVFSSDPTVNIKCKKCKELLCECTCIKDEVPQMDKFIAILRIEKAGRNGKTVTVIDHLPPNEKFLKDLTTLLKKKCGCGGTHLMRNQFGIIEIQGDKKEVIRIILTKEKIKYKG